jgi:hypothetical protein
MAKHFTEFRVPWQQFIQRLSGYDYDGVDHGLQGGTSKIQAIRVRYYKDCKANLVFLDTPGTMSNVTVSLYMSSDAKRCRIRSMAAHRHHEQVQRNCEHSRGVSLGAAALTKSV